MHSPTARQPAIIVRGLSKTIENPSARVEILRDIDFEVPAGQFAVIMGASGSGKSTLLGLLAGLDTVSSGSVVLDGVDISRMREDDLARLRGRKIGFVFQSYQLVPTLNAEENVLLPAELSGAGREFRERAAELLQRVGLANRTQHYPVQLSGGEQQRVALARAFISRPRMLYADEPTGNLDAETSEMVIQLLFTLHRDAGTTLMLVTHDLDVAQQTQRIIRLKGGMIVEDSGPPPLRGPGEQGHECLGERP